MRILYLWVEKYREFINQEFNLSSQFEFKYKEKENFIVCSKNELYINNFFSLEKNGNTNISELIAVVGNNGVGKTTFLELILEICSLNEKKLKEEKTQRKNNKEKKVIEKNNLDYILIYIKNNDIGIISSKDNVVLKTCDNKIIESTRETEILEELSLIYHSNTFDNKIRYINTNKNIYDISTINLIKQDNEKVQNKSNFENYNRIFFEEELKRQIEFITKCGKSKKYFDFNIPSELNIKFIDFEELLDNILKRIDSNIKSNTYKRVLDQNGYNGTEFLDNIYTTIDSIYRISFELKKNKANMNTFKINITEGFFINILDLILERPKKSKLDDIEILSIIQKLDNVLEDCYDDINEYMNVEDYLNNVNKLIYKLSNLYVKHTARLIKLLEKFNELIINLNSYRIGFNYDDSYSITMDNPKKLKEFYELYNFLVIKYEFIRFSWGLSSGENNLLSLFSRLFYVITNKIDQSSNNMYDLTILMDEADLSFHPEWQRKYIKLIIDFLNNIFCKYKIHLILTTHSPILLSDIPNENIIYLSKNRDRSICIKRDNKTFGANIYNLYKDNFYFNSDDVFNTIGEFAEYKINEVKGLINELKDSELEKLKHDNDIKNKLYLLYKISNKIGEKLIRDSLLDEYYKISKSINSYDTKEVGKYFESLSEEDRRLLIKYIINKYEN